MNSEENKKYMRRAIELAYGGEGWTNPNPLVGAVIVKNGEIIGEGFHHKYGELHAEREALKNCLQRGNDPAGAEIFVTLEPCCHYGKQPPCTEALVSAGIAHVFVGSRDPNPLVHGKGNEFLREHGVEVTEDFLKDECDRLNSIFFYYITTKIPYVALKYAMTLDGKIAARTGESKWITGEKSRRFVQQLRNRYAGIMCGSGTVLADDPILNCRIEGGNNPVRIICDSKLRIPLESKIVKTAGEIKTIVACSKDAFAAGEKSEETSDGLNFSEKKSALEKAGIDVIVTENGKDGRVNLTELMKILGEKYRIDSVLVEGGGQLNYSVLEAGLVNHIYAFTAPKIFGGKAKSPVDGQGVEKPSDAFLFDFVKSSSFDGDVLLEYEKQN